MLCLTICLTNLQTGISKPDIRIPFAALSHISQHLPATIQQKLLDMQVDVDQLIETAKSKVTPCTLVDIKEHGMHLLIAVKPVLEIGRQSKLPDNRQP